MGVTNSLFKGDNGSQELSAESLAILVDYIRLLGVPPKRQVLGNSVKQGEKLFKQIGCEDCHRAELTTSQYHPYPELRNQVISA
nr:di-heme oxidoredictase family protein [Spartinivicinus marinus]